MSGTIINSPACQTRHRATALQRRYWLLYGMAAMLAGILGIAWPSIPPRGQGPSPERSATVSRTALKPIVARPDPAPVNVADQGRELFSREWLPDDPRSRGGDGLGPVFNDSSCVACHNLGGAGGGGPNSKNVDILSVNDGNLRRPPARPEGDPGSKALAELHPGFGNATSVVLHRFGTAPDYVGWRMEHRGGLGGGLSDPFAAQNVQNGPPGLWAKLEIEQLRMAPVGRNTSGGVRLSHSQRNPTALFGAGAIDSIPDDVISEAALRSFPEFPEVKGRVSLQQDGRIGRFGWKAQVPSLREFVVTACAVELGLESPGQSQGTDPTELDARAPGLDLTVEDCDALVAFVRSLPAPGQQVSPGEAKSSPTRAGREAFLSIGCGTCHTPDLGGVEGIYSDLLLHDMGSETSDTGSYRMFRPESSGPTAGTVDLNKHPDARGATAAEWRTPPLWGLRDSAPYLHDGRAETLDQAIALHGGQGKDPATRYFGLSPRRRQQVQAFLKSLVAPTGHPSS